MSGTRRVWAVATLLGVALAVGGWLALRTDHSPPPSMSTAAPFERTGPAEAETTSEADPGSLTRRSWREVALAYAAALTDTRGGIASWLDRLSPYVSGPLLDSYRGSDLSELPSGRPTRIRATGHDADQRRARALFDSGYVLDIRLERVDGRWLVTSSGEHLTAARR